MNNNIMKSPFNIIIIEMIASLLIIILLTWGKKQTYNNIMNYKVNKAIYKTKYFIKKA